MNKFKTCSAPPWLMTLISEWRFQSCRTMASSRTRWMTTVRSRSSKTWPTYSGKYAMRARSRASYKSEVLDPRINTLQALPCSNQCLKSAHAVQVRRMLRKGPLIQVVILIFNLEEARSPKIWTWINLIPIRIWPISVMIRSKSKRTKDSKKTMVIWARQFKLIQNRSLRNLGRSKLSKSRLNNHKRIRAKGRIVNRYRKSRQTIKY